MCIGYSSNAVPKSVSGGIVRPSGPPIGGVKLGCCPLYPARFGKRIYIKPAGVNGRPYPRIKLSLVVQPDTYPLCNSQILQQLEVSSCRLAN